MNNISQRLDYKIAKWYLYLLPIRMISPFIFLRELLPGATIYFDFLLNILGLILVLLSSNQKEKDLSLKKLFRFFVKMILWFNFSSLLMSFIIQNRFGNYGTESSFSGIIGMEVYFFHYILIVYYNRRVFELIGLENIKKIIQKICTYLLVIGYIQLAVIKIDSLGLVYDTFDFLDILADFKVIQVKLALTASEGAGAGVLIGTFVYPYLLSQLLVNNRRIKKYIYQIVLWIPIIYYTHSSTCYIAILIDLIVWAYFLLKNKGHMFTKIAIPLITCSLLLLSSLTLKEINDIRYMTFEKAVDLNNGSTASRSAPLYLNWAAFKDNPLIGVGNGLQGYYVDEIPRQLFFVQGTDLGIFLERAKNQIINGGVFIPGVISGYGILGCILIFIYFLKSHKIVNQRKENLGIYYYFYKISFITLLFVGFVSDFYGNYIIWFILSLPYIYRIKKNT